MRDIVGQFGRNSKRRRISMGKSRAEKAGEQLGNAINEMADLMYQSNTKRNFYKGLKNVLEGR